MLKDVANEGIIIGFIYRFPELLNEYMELIIPKFDFTNQEVYFLYKILMESYIEYGHLDKTSISIYISTLDDENKALWKQVKGFETLNKLAEISKSIETFEIAYKKLKVFNVLRHLDKQGFNVKDNLDKFKNKDADFIIKFYENQLVKSVNYVKNINDSELLGKDILKTYEKLKETPEIGITIPFPIIDSITRGWRKNTIYAHAMHSGYGKSRLISNILSNISIFNQIPVLFCVNEQNKMEIELMILTCVANNMFAKEHGILINESDIALGNLKDKADEIMIKAAKYIEKNTKLYFYEMQIWDLNSIKMILKRNKFKGIDYAVIDTFKAMRGIYNNGMSDWMQFVHTAEKLKEIIGSEKKGGLDMGLWITLQMTDDSLISKLMNSTSLATGKQVKHHLDYLMLFRPITKSEKDKIKVMISMPNNAFNGTEMELKKDKQYYLGVVDKNRGGRDKQQIIYEVDKGSMIFKELGYAINN
jgi:replicative DNA helicase